MIAAIDIEGKTTRIDLTKPLDISIRLGTNPNYTSAWYVSPVQIEPVVMGDWIGSVEQGGSVNFRNVSFNPHGNGTHTECVGHISKEVYSVNEQVKQFFFTAQVISVNPIQKGEDHIITLQQIKEAVGNNQPKAIIIRTLPNDTDKLQKQYSNTNPCYMEAESAQWLREIGVEHLLIDLPSVDREEDGGLLAAHKAFWNYPNAPRMQATITELIYVPNTVEDGNYILDLHFAPFENDASPSRPVLYKPL